MIYYQNLPPGPKGTYGWTKEWVAYDELANRLYFILWSADDDVICGSHIAHRSSPRSSNLPATANQFWAIYNSLSHNG